MLGLVWAVIVGLIVGALAKLIMPGKDPGGILITIVIGIAGSLVANLLGSALGLYGPGEAPGIIMSVVGALLLLWVYRMFKASAKPA